MVTPFDILYGLLLVPCPFNVIDDFKYTDGLTPLLLDTVYTFMSPDVVTYHDDVVFDELGDIVHHALDDVYNQSVSLHVL